MVRLFFSFFIVAFGQPAFVPFLSPLAAAFGYALFWRSIVDWPSKKSRFWAAFLWYAGVQAVQLSWMSTTEYQGIYILFVHAALALFLGLQFALLSHFVKKESSFLFILALSSFWTLIEWSRFFVFCGFSFNLAGLALSTYLWPLQMASIFGVLGLSFWVICVNLMALRALVLNQWKAYVACAMAAIFPYVWGACQLTYHQGQKGHKTIVALLLQTGLLPSEKVALQGRVQEFVSPYEQWRRILQIIHDHGRADLIVLPEAALPFTCDAAIYSSEKMANIFDEIGSIKLNSTQKRLSNGNLAQTLSNHLKSEIIIGLDCHDGVNYNSAFHFVPERENYERYDKRILIPLAEYLPFQWLYPLVKNYGITDFFTQGQEKDLFYGCLPMAASICYEETFPYLMREGRLKGAKLFVNVTNDGWYPRSKLAQQHFDHARLRAVENGVCLLRSCNTGITGAVDSCGRILAVLPEFDESGKQFIGAVKIKIDSYNYPTLYTFWGNGGILTLSFFLIILFFYHEKISLRLPKIRI